MASLVQGIAAMIDVDLNKTPIEGDGAA